MKLTNSTIMQEEAGLIAPRSTFIESLITSQWIWHTLELLFILAIVVLFKVRLRRTGSALYLQPDSTTTLPFQEKSPLVKIAAHKNGSKLVSSGAA